MSEFTPGPWYNTTQPEWENEPVTAHIQSASKNEDNYICAVEILDAECEANARLIAVAPDLLFMLQDLILNCVDFDEWPRTVTSAKALIELAGGDYP